MDHTITKPPSSRPAAGLKNYECYLGYACNRSCRFCFVEKQDRARFGRPPAFAEISSGIYAAGARGFSSLALLGGEPTLYPELPKLIRVAKRTGYKRVLLFSNGLKLADNDFLRRLADAGLDGVSLNIPSHRETVFTFLTRRERSFPLLLQALENLARLKVPASAVCVLNRLNYKTLSDYAAFYSPRGVRAFVLQYLKFQGNINPFTQRENPDIDALKVKMSATVPYIRKMAAYCVARGFYPPFLDCFVPCVLKGLEPRLAGFDHEPARSRSDFLCWHPDIKTAATYDIAYKDCLKPPACSSCAYSGKCAGVMKNYIQVFGSAEFRPVKKPRPPFYSGLKGRRLSLARASFEEAMAREPGGAGKSGGQNQ